MRRTFDVCGSRTLECIEGILRGRGYRAVYTRPSEPGEYCVGPIDAAPGWADWMYEVEAIELPEQPVDGVLAAYAAIEAAELAKKA